MAQRVFLNSAGTTRFTLKTIRTVIPGFAEWGAEVRRERKKSFLFVTYWSTEGDIPDLAVEFDLSDGTTVTGIQANVRNQTSPGFRKVFLNSFNTPSGDLTSIDLVRNVVAISFILGSSRVLSHN